MVRCKFVCTNKLEQVNGGANIKMEPVYCGSEENKKFFDATPSGEISFYCINPEAAKQVEQGKEYYIDISEA